VTVLVNLPTETIQEIYSHLELFVDIVCLSTTCQVLWEIGRANMYRRIESIAASYSWAGDRILCIGDYLKNKDIPEKILTPEEMNEFTDDGQNTFYNYPFYTVSGVEFSMGRLWSKCGVETRLLKDAYPRSSFAVLSHLCSLDYTPPPLMHPTVLRNLSRRQYVRESALFELQAKYAETEILQEVGFGEIVITRICLSSDPSVSISYDGPIHRGVWAGDRFDIVASSEWHDPTWTDASDEVLEELEKIWISEYS
jgi:hypothetical protein